MGSGPVLSTWLFASHSSLPINLPRKGQVKREAIRGELVGAERSECYGDLRSHHWALGGDGEFWLIKLMVVAGTILG